MVIANPIYDVVFKKLMEDNRIAKFFIATLLNETIEEVQFLPQEFTYTDELIGLAVYRVDFIATIKTATGEYKKVLIEIQNAKNEFDLMRFRNYLAAQYKKQDEITTYSGKMKMAFPIVTIYLLGFNLNNIETSVVRVKRNYIDLITNEVIDKKNDFIEKLTHDCFVVQLLKIEGKYQTRLDKLLSVFEQNGFYDDTKIIKSYNHTVDEDEIKNITDVLHYIGTEPVEKKQIEDEIEAWRTFDALTAGIKDKALALQKKVEEKEKEIERKGKELENKGKEIENKDKELENKGKEIENKDKELENKDKELENKDKELENKDKELENKGKEIENKGKEIENKDKELESKGKEIEDKDKLIEELKKKLGII